MSGKAFVGFWFLFVFVILTVACLMPAAQAQTRTSVEQRITALCSELFRNSTSGILLIITPNAKDSDRVCLQDANDQLRCKNVKQLREVWGKP